MNRGSKIAITIGLIVLGIGLVYLQIFLGLSSSIGTDENNIYYFYSSAAQAIAAFVAFLIAGYALFYQAMDNRELKDDTLKEINFRMKLAFYKQLILLFIITGSAIITSLMAVWFNRFDLIYRTILMAVANILIGSTIIYGLYVVMDFINPKKTADIADKLYEEYEDLNLSEPPEYANGSEPSKEDIEQPKASEARRHTNEFRPLEDELNEVKPAEKIDDRALFLNYFISLESDLKSLLEWNDIIVRPRLTYPSFREIVEALRSSKILNEELYDRLYRINKFRNVIVHGREQEIDKNLIEEVRELNLEINRILNDIKNKKWENYS